MTDIEDAYANALFWQSHFIDILNDLLRCENAACDDAITQALSRIGTLAGSDRTYVFQLREGGRLANSHEWVAPGIAPMIDDLQDLEAGLIDEWQGAFRAGSEINIERVEALDESSRIKSVLQMHGVKSVLAVPMMFDQDVAGFVGFDALSEHRRFRAEEIQLLKSLANTIGAVLQRAHASAAADQAAARLRKERDRLHTTLAAIPDIVLDLDGEGRFEACTTGSNGTPPFLPEDFIGKRAEEILPPHIATCYRKILAAADEERDGVSAECEVELSGEILTYQATAAPKAANGVRNGYVIVVRDITDGKHRMRLNTRLSKLAELTTNMVLVTDPTGDVEWVNPAFEQRTGWGLEDARGQPVVRFLGAAETNHHQHDRIHDAISRQQALQAELLIGTRTGDTYWIRLDMQPLFDPDGRPEGFILVQTDISDLKQSQARAWRERAIALELSSDGIAIGQVDGPLSYMNRSYREMFGLDVNEDIRALTWRDLYAPEDADELVGNAVKALRSAGTWHGEANGRHRNGERVAQELSVTLLEEDVFFAIARDITAKNQVEREKSQLREVVQIAQRRETLSQVAQGVAHDLANLVAVVSGTATTMELEARDHPSLANGLSRIQSAMTAAKDIIEGLRHLDRPDLPRAQHDLHTLLRQGIDLLGADRIDDHAVTVKASGAAQRVWANPTDVLQVVVNLAINACDARQDTSNRVTIEILPEDGPHPGRAPDVGDVAGARGLSWFQVRDTGAGVDPAIMDKLFQQNFTTKGEFGTGMGLPIVASILRDNQAALWFDSVPGEGSAVTVAWPAQDETPEILMPPLSLVRSADLLGQRILVVDDIPLVSDMLSEMLESAGAVAMAVSSPQEAVELLKEAPHLWSAVVTDMQMPEMNGAELAHKANALNPALPVILVTAQIETVGSLANRFAAVLGKPVTQDQLVTALKSTSAAKTRRNSLN